MKKAFIILLLVLAVSANAYTPAYNPPIDSSTIRAIIILDWWAGDSGGDTPVQENALSTDDSNLILTDDGNQILMDRP